MMNFFVGLSGGIAYFTFVDYPRDVKGTLIVFWAVVGLVCYWFAYTINEGNRKTTL
jgi:hypothetical protein